MEMGPIPKPPKKDSSQGEQSGQGREITGTEAQTGGGLERFSRVEQRPAAPPGALRRAREREQRKAAQSIGGNEFDLSSEVKVTSDGTALQVRIDQKQLVAHDFTTILSALTRLHTKGRLIQQGRFADLSASAHAQDNRFVEEANLIITNVTYNSPALLTLLTDPGTATAVVTGAVTLALALQKVIESIAHARIELVKTRRTIQDQDLEGRQKQIAFALDAAGKYVNAVCASCDQETKEKMVQTLVPDISELLTLKRKHG